MQPSLCCAPSILFVVMMLSTVGCRTTVPVHVWESPKVNPGPYAKLALAPLAGSPEIARRIEREMLAQRPAASADVAIFTSEQLAEGSPIRLVSTAALTSDLTAIQAARAVGANLLLQGEILSAQIESLDEEKPPEAPVNMNQLFFQRLKQDQPKNESLLLSWRVIDANSSETLGSNTFTLRTKDAEQLYPDLLASYENSTSRLIAAAARETWKSLSPVVARSQVKLASPWLQLGAWRVRRGVAAAKDGQWELAETHWRKAANLFPFNASAQHNLAVAMAAREDFSAAKQQLLKARGPFAIRLPTDTLFWLDQNHRRYHEAHGLPRPREGWAFPEPIESMSFDIAKPLNVRDLPWWTAVPFAKPPDWTWQSWLTQPLVL